MLLNLFVLISVYVSVEMLEVARAALVASREDVLGLKHSDSGKGKPEKVFAKARTSKLNE